MSKTIKDSELPQFLNDLEPSTDEPIIIVKDGQPSQVVLNHEQYQTLKKGRVGSKPKRLKGVILAGGHATRLRPLTKVTNKHLLPLYDKPMIFYPLESMKRAGVEDVLIITNPQHAGDFLNLLGDGEDFGLSLSYTLQEKPGGLAQAVSLAESFVGDSPFMVILGDNVFEIDLRPAVKKFTEQGEGARVFAQKHPDPRQYGVVEIGENGRVVSIEEKPAKPRSNYIQVGVYMYYPDVFDHIRTLKPSERGELEITDLNNIYLAQKQFFCEVWDESEWWIDAGTSHVELLKANLEVVKRRLFVDKDSSELDKLIASF